MIEELLIAGGCFLSGYIVNASIRTIRDTKKSADKPPAPDQSPTSPYREPGERDADEIGFTMPGPPVRIQSDSMVPKYGLATKCPRCGAGTATLCDNGVKPPVRCETCKAWSSLHFHQDCQRCNSKWVRLASSDDESFV